MKPDPTARLPVLAALLLTALLAACSGLLPPVEELAPLPTRTSEPSPTATITIVWFPATSTPTSLPTREVVPTPDRLVDLGRRIVADSMNRPGAWQLQANDIGRAAFGNNELTLAIAKPEGYLYSYRSEPLVNDFYMEMNASTSLCRAADSYGLLFRSSSPTDTYRYAVNCLGQIRFERIKNYQSAVIQDWTPSGQIPMGAPVELRLGVWARGKEFRFFVNDVYQFTASDPVFDSGSVGVFARSGGQNAVTVNFSALELYAVGSD